MYTWTCISFKGHYPVGSAAVVTAEDIETAVLYLEKGLANLGLKQKIKPEDLIPLPTQHRHVRILVDGEY